MISTSNAKIVVICINTELSIGAQKARWTTVTFIFSLDAHGKVCRRMILKLTFKRNTLHIAPIKGQLMEQYISKEGFGGYCDICSQSITCGLPNFACDVVIAPGCDLVECPV